MDSPIQSLHHVTATVDAAQADLDFYARLLGLRLVKRTVNFDNHNVFHFYYGNATGTPGTIMTTFPYHGMGVPVGRKGAGQITATAFSVPESGLADWQRRLSQQGQGLAVREGETPFGEAALTVTDPSGLMVNLVGTKGDTRQPWVSSAGDIGAGAAIRGIHGVTLTIREPARSLDLLEDVLGFRVVNEAPGATRLAVGQGGPGAQIEIVHAPEAPPAVNGLGTVHHVAFAVPDADTQVRMRAELVRLGLQVTEVLDRQYFRSIYFREPGGVLFEIATVPPGFTVDESLDTLGQALKLPPWEEPNRRSIETHLPAVSL